MAKMKMSAVCNLGSHPSHAKNDLSMSLVWSKIWFHGSWFGPDISFQQVQGEKLDIEVCRYWSSKRRWPTWGSAGRSSCHTQIWRQIVHWQWIMHCWYVVESFEGNEHYIVSNWNTGVWALHRTRQLGQVEAKSAAFLLHSFTAHFPNSRRAVLGRVQEKACTIRQPAARAFTAYLNSSSFRYWSLFSTIQYLGPRWFVAFWDDPADFNLTEWCCSWIAFRKEWLDPC